MGPDGKLEGPEISVVETRGETEALRTSHSALALQARMGKEPRAAALKRPSRRQSLKG